MSAPSLSNPPRTSRAALLGATLALFLVWSNTFLAFEVLLAPKTGAAPMDWLDLTVARFVPVVLVCAAWCFGFRRRESLAILKEHGGRLFLCGLLVVPLYSACLYFPMQFLSVPVMLLTERALLTRRHGRPFGFREPHAVRLATGEHGQ